MTIRLNLRHQRKSSRRTAEPSDVWADMIGSRNLNFSSDDGNCKKCNVHIHTMVSVASVVAKKCCPSPQYSPGTGTEREEASRPSDKNERCQVTKSWLVLSPCSTSSEHTRETLVELCFPRCAPCTGVGTEQPPTFGDTAVMQCGLPWRVDGTAGSI